MAKVLVVDDSEVVRVELTEALSKAGFEAFAAESGTRAIGLIEAEGPFDLLITDFNMPEMDGLSLCKIVRDQLGLKALPVIMLTSEKSEDVKAEGKRLGVTVWGVKPVHPETLVELAHSFCQ